MPPCVLTRGAVVTYCPRMRVLLGLLILLSSQTAAAQFDGENPGASAPAPLTAAQKMALANRFRPFIMTSRDGGKPESYRPTTWQNFVPTTQIRQGYTGRYCVRLGGILNQGSIDDWPEGSPVYIEPGHQEVTQDVLAADPSVLLRLPHGNVTGINGGIVNPGYALHVTKADDRHGEDWATVLAQGDGIYAHVEQVVDEAGGIAPFVNIEYTVLWSYNSSSCDHHSGDITTMVVLYNSETDLISRLSYAPHDYALEAFVLADATAVDFYPLLSIDLDGIVRPTNAVALTMPAAHQYQQGDGGHSPGFPIVYLVADPQTARFEHPVAMAETGGHELWPNTSGSILDAASHYADGVSFLPQVAAIDPVTMKQIGMQMMGRDDQTDVNAPFVFFNGLIGTDGNPPLLHRTWYWPEGRSNNLFHIPDTRFSGKHADPYRELSAGAADLVWPPSPDFTNETTTAYVGGAYSPPLLFAVPNLAAQPPGRQGVDDKFNAQLYYPTTRLNDPFHPFEDILQALSLTPCGGTIAIRPGAYVVSAPLQRNCTCDDRAGIKFTAPIGPVTITKASGVPGSSYQFNLVLSR